MENPGCRKLRRLCDELFLPHEILMEILSRLPAKDALRFRCVCKSVKELIDSPNFTDLHIRRINGAPMILALKGWDGLRLLGECWESGGNRSNILKSHLYPLYSMRLSQDGLIVSEKRYSTDNRRNTFVIFNPIYPENVTITVPNIERRQIGICGVFFHSPLKEYRTLWEITTNVSLDKEDVRYCMLNLDSQPNWREISSPWARNYSRIKNIPPVLVNNKYLYWIVHGPYNFISKEYMPSIMEFDTTNEQFEMIPCPAPVVSICRTSLRNVDGVLSFVRLSGVNTVQEPVDINIWTLKDRLKKLWTCSDCVINKKVKHVIDLLNGEIVFHDRLQLFVYNLRLQTISDFGWRYKANRFTAHVMSLASLKNCKSKIHMEEGDNWPIPLLEI